MREYVVVGMQSSDDSEESIQALGSKSLIGPPFSEEMITHNAVISNPLDACSELITPDGESESMYANKIVLVVRGKCTFHDKIWNIQNAAAAAAIIIDNADHPNPFYMSMLGNENNSLITIPSTFISARDGKTLISSLVNFPEEKLSVHFSTSPLYYLDKNDVSSLTVNEYKSFLKDLDSVIQDLDFEGPIAQFSVQIQLPNVRKDTTDECSSVLQEDGDGELKNEEKYNEVENGETENGGTTDHCNIIDQNENNSKLKKEENKDEL